MIDKLNDTFYFFIVIGGSFFLGFIAGIETGLYKYIADFSWEILIGFASVIIAAFAFIHTLIFAYETNRFNKSTVRPHLTLWTHTDYINMSFDLYIRNNGIGPAIINEFKYLVDDVPIECKGSEAVENLFKKLFSDYEYNYTPAYIGAFYVMSVSEEVKLFNITFEGENIPSKEFVDNAADSVDLFVKYESVYGEKLDINTKKMKQIMNLF